MIIANRLLVPFLMLAFVPTLSGQDGDKKRLQGTWVVESAEMGGKPLDFFKGATMTFKGEVVVMSGTMPGGQEGMDESYYKLDEFKTPKRLTLFSKKDRDKATWWGIYELKGEVLKLCMSGPGVREHPKDFNAKDSLLFTLKLQKK